MQRLTATIISLLLLGLFSLGLPQIQAQSRKSSRTPRPRLFDDFGSLRHCDLTARLDNFAIQLQNAPKEQGYIVVYAPPVNSRGDEVLSALKDYLINTRGLESEKVTTIYGGRNDKPSAVRIQLWLAPPGAPALEPAKFEVKPEAFKGMFDEHEAWDDIRFYSGEGEGDGISTSVSLEGFEDVLKHQPKSLVYVVGYHSDKSAPGAWRRITDEQVDVLKKRGFEANRFRTIYGGEQKEAKVQIWIQPEADPPPVKDAGPESPPKEAVQIGDYGDYELGNKDYERQAFKRLQEILRAYPGLRGCLIVRVGQPDPEAEEILESVVYNEVPLELLEGPTEPIEPDPEPADVLKLSEKWKTELATLSIREDRLVILFSKAHAGSTGSLETWAVPSAASLPDPEAIFKEETIANPSSTQPINNDTKLVPTISAESPKSASTQGTPRKP